MGFNLNLQGDQDKVAFRLFDRGEFNTRVSLWLDGNSTMTIGNIKSGQEIISAFFSLIFSRRTQRSVQPMLRVEFSKNAHQTQSCPVRMNRIRSS